MGRQPKDRRSDAQSREAETPDSPAGSATSRRRRIKRGRLFSGTALSLASHLLVLLALLAAWPEAPRPVEPETIMVSLTDMPHLAAPPAPPAPVAPARAAPATPASAPKIARPTPAPPAADPPPSAKSAPAVTGPEVSGAQLAGAGNAESGGSGQSCNMARRLQDVLRRDPLVQTSVAGLGGKAVMVWNGDWVWMHGEVGKGLAAVRQAMMWEIAFAPESCRTQAMHGLIVLTSNGTDGPARLVVGSDQWRWSDLLTPHPGAAGAVLANQ